MQPVLAEAKAKESNPREALLTLLRINPSLKNTENEEAYNRALINAMCAIRVEDAKSFLDPLDPTQLDLLMKAIYCGFKPISKPSPSGPPEVIPQKADQCLQLLKWHAVVLEKAGVGSIVRSIAEKTPFPPSYVPPEDEFDDDV